MKTTNKKQATQAQVNTQATQALSLPTKAVTLAEYIGNLMQQASSLTAVKQARKQINANLAEFSVSYGYKDILTGCKDYITALCEDRSIKALRDLTYRNVLNAVAPLVMNSQEFRDIATNALKVGAYEVKNPVEFCQRYFSAVTAEGTLLVSQSFITTDRKYIAGLYVVKNLTPEIAVSVLKQAFRNFDRLSRQAFGVGRNLNNIRIEGALSGKIYEAVQGENGTYERGAQVEGAQVTSADFADTLTAVNAELKKQA